MIATSEGDDAHRRRLGVHLDAMLALCETVECRRVQLLNYFGQEGAACGNCDTCLVPPESWDGTVAAQKVLSTVYRLDRERRQKFGVGHVVDILLGKQTPKVQQHNHESLTVFGVGTDLAEPVWRGVVRQLLAQGLLTVEGDHGTLVLTEASNEVLGKRREVRLRHEAARAAKSPSSRSKTAPKVELSPEKQPVFEKLRAWRAATAKEQGMPAYVIFHDATLRQIATESPATLAQLGGISGVGENKLAKFGQQILDTLAE
jgi:ATP-dependent DNA helicase RecQ